MFPLTLPASCISENYIKTKINLNPYFHTSLRRLKCFMKTFKASTKPGTKRSMKIKFKLIFSLHLGWGREVLIPML